MIQAKIFYRGGKNQIGKSFNLSPIHANEIRNYKICMDCGKKVHPRNKTLRCMSCGLKRAFAQRDPEEKKKQALKHSETMKRLYATGEITSANLGKPMSELTKMKLSLRMMGRKYSPTHSEKIRKARLKEYQEGRIPPMEGKRHSKQSSFIMRNKDTSSISGERNGRWKGGISRRDDTKNNV